MKLHTKDLIKYTLEQAECERLLKAFNGFYRADHYAQKASEASNARYEAGKPIDEACKEVEKRCTERTITYVHVARYLIDVNNRLSVLLKKEMEGCEIKNADPRAQTFKSAYKYTPYSTHFDAIYKKGEWIITKIYRDKCDKHGGTLILTETAEKALIQKIKQL